MNGTLSWLMAATIGIDRSYHAEPDEKRLARLVATWDPALCGPLLVSRREDGGLYALDGYHRLVALKRLGKGGEKVPCLVQDGLDQRAEVRAYLASHQTRIVSPVHRLVADLEAHDPDALEMTRLVKRTGWGLVSPGRMEAGRLGCIQTLMRCFKEDPARLELALDLLRYASPDDRDLGRAVVIRSLFIALAGRTVDRKRPMAEQFMDNGPLARLVGFFRRNPGNYLTYRAAMDSNGARGSNSLVKAMVPFFLNIQRKGRIS